MQNVQKGEQKPRAPDKTQPERQLRGFALSLTDFVELPYPLVNKGYKQQVSRLIVR